MREEDYSDWWFLGQENPPQGEYQMIDGEIYKKVDGVHGQCLVCGKFKDEVDDPIDWVYNDNNWCWGCGKWANWKLTASDSTESMVQ
jgi:hypothetical protein